MTRNAFVIAKSTISIVIQEICGILAEIGTRIPIRQPSENSQDYVSYKLCYPLNCQAICDAYGKFIDVEIKWHDPRVFANCVIQKSCSAGKFKLFYKDLLDGREFVPQLLLGGPAYPILPYVMKEYDHSNSNEQVVFSTMLRSARNQIKWAFGCLKAT